MHLTQGRLLGQGNIEADLQGEKSAFGSQKQVQVRVSCLGALGLFEKLRPGCRKGLWVAGGRERRGRSAASVAPGVMNFNLITDMFNAGSDGYP